MESFLQDLQFGLRALFKDKTLAVVALLALAIGTGANTAIFSVINAVLIRPLPYGDPDRIVMLWAYDVPNQDPAFPISAPDLEDYRKQNNVFEAIASYAYDDFNLTSQGEPERVQGSFVSTNFFDVLGVKPALGSGFPSFDDQPDGSRVAIIGNTLWKRRFGSDPNIVNQTLEINGESFDVVGVMPSSFRAPDPLDEIWVPMSFYGNDESRIPSGYTAEDLQDRKNRFMVGVAKLKPGVTASRAQAEMKVIAKGLEDLPENEDTNAGISTNIVPIHEQIVGDVQPALIALLAAVALVLLIACANVANLLLARAAARQKEVAIRLALGATRLRLIRQLLTESLVLGLAGGAMGLLLAWGGIKLLVALNPPRIPRLEEFNIDLRVLAFTLLISTLTGIIFGLVPALQASKPNLNETLKEGTRGSTGGTRSQRIRNLIVISQIVLTQVLLIGAALMLKSFLSLQSVDPGFKPEHVLTMQVTLPALKYSENYQVAAFYENALKRIKEINTVDSAGVITLLPLTESKSAFEYAVEGKPHAPDEHPKARFERVSEDYFRAMGISILKGRFFNEGDRIEFKKQGDAEKKQSELVAIINKAMAEKYWPGEDPTQNKQIKILNYKNGALLKVVGVVEDVKHSKLSDTQPGAQVYVPYLQSPLPFMALVIRAKSDPEAITRAVTDAIQKDDPKQPVYLVKTMETIVGESISQPRLYMALLAIFAAIALLLAAIGIYGVMSYMVTQRTHEIGIRMALGAQQKDILKMIIGQGMLLALIGAIIGLAIAVALGLIASQAWPDLTTTLLFGVGVSDLTTFLIIPALLIAVALLSISIPAFRATKVDPMIALRYE